MSDATTIRIGEETFRATRDLPFVFGRADAEGVIGLNPDDMGVSGVAGSVESHWDVWWVVNQSTKRPLLVEPSPGATPTSIDPGHRYAIATAKVRLLVPGALFTYPLEILVPERYSASLAYTKSTGSGTIVPGDDVALSEADRVALAAMLAGYLEPWPHRREVPNGYSDAARLAGGDWTGTAIRKRIERIRERYAEAGLYFEGERAREDLAAHLITNGLLTGADLELLKGRRSR